MCVCDRSDMDRYWGTPLPIWVSDDYEEIVVVGSVKELEELSGVTGITDIHRHKYARLSSSLFSFISLMMSNIHRLRHPPLTGMS